ncbi:MAG: 2-C-methyl-D-erythritol 4-phosphate cytidylyltransferase [Acidobacteriaceae bacterium]
MKVFVILPAAGLGTRMATGGAARRDPKQFLELGGQPILVMAVRAFLQVPAIHQIFVAVRKSELVRVESQLRKHDILEKVSVIEGGDTRQDSVSNALKMLPAEDEDIVLVHDAVRPLIDPAIIERTIESVERHQAAIVAVPAIDTIKQVERTADGAIITTTIPRERIVLAQTPQGFRYHILRRGVDAAEKDGFIGTDDASLVERLGIEVAVVQGSPRNLKITQPGDLLLAEYYLHQN